MIYAISNDHDHKGIVSQATHALIPDKMNIAVFKTVKILKKFWLLLCVSCFGPLILKEEFLSKISYVFENSLLIHLHFLSCIVN